MRLAPLTAALLFACGGSKPGPPPATEAVSYHRDVAPILARSCLGCHVEGGLAPFPLATYAQVKAQAAAIKSATQSRTMPPWHVDNSGACQQYVDARWLTGDELATLSQWADDGAPEGAALPPPTPRALTALTEVTTTLELGLDYTPAGNGSDDYRCFIVDPAIGADAFLTAYQVNAGQPREVHHVLLFGLTDPDAETQAQMLDAAEPGPGYTCFGGPRVDSGFSVLAGWAPGAGATFYPQGTGVRLSGGHKVVMQVHYNLANGAAPDRTTVALTLKPSVDHEAMVLGLADTGLDLPPHLASITQGMTTTLTGTDTYHVLGVFPHMHTLGRTMRVERARGASTECLVDVPHWDFHWQQFYFYQQPFDVVPGDAVTLECGFDTSSSDTEVKWGEGTSDEMCLAGFYVTKN
ncbi:MAG: hypothetical protein QM723_39960 [Myxococcaceae bacterium]